MPGPGGGSRGGGGGRGGSFGGGSRGGSFGGGFHGGRPMGGPRPPMGGYHRPPMHRPRPPMGGWGMYPRRRYSGGGCLGSLMNMIFGPIIFVIVILFFLFIIMGNGVTVQETGNYDENALQDYANRQYEAEFGGSSAYEDNLLITFLIDDEEYYDFYYIAWVGDHIATDINHMLGNNDTVLGQAMNACINATSYKYSLDSNLAQVMEMMSRKIQALGLENSFTCTENHAQVTSHLTNHTNLDMTEDTVNDALAAFTDATGIPVVIVVEDMDAVFGRTVANTSGSSVSFVLILGLIAIVVIVLVVKKQRRRNFGDTYDNVPPNNTEF